ncbi:hypothetical protein [Thiobacillus denitrificans]|uniref:hypothetical protein n=1 Tax=Thiobacillus denitrificans TaxID=36861 RepID=UPI00059C330A|nr:hypothetical protein [Thiobacillus denitrificans]
MNEENNLMMVWGALTSLLGILGFLLWMVTAEDPAAERRASRWGALAGVFCAGLVLFAEWWLYAFINAAAGLFMMMPSALIAIAAMWLAGRAVYRAFGGGQEKQELKVVIDPETHERQGGIWCQLRDLPHFRETLRGDLINLATGDRLYWIVLEGKRCIEMELAGKTRLTASRYETLTKYLTVQRGMGRLLAVEESRL